MRTTSHLKIFILTTFVITLSGCNKEIGLGSEGGEGENVQELVFSMPTQGVQKNASRADAGTLPESRVENLRIFFFEQGMPDTAFPVYEPEVSISSTNPWTTGNFTLALNLSRLDMAKTYDMFVLANLPQRTLDKLVQGSGNITPITRQAIRELNEEMPAGVPPRTADNPAIVFSAYKSFKPTREKQTIELFRHVARMVLNVQNKTGGTAKITLLNLLSERRYTSYIPTDSGGVMTSLERTQKRSLLSANITIPSEATGRNIAYLYENVNLPSSPQNADKLLTEVIAEITDSLGNTRTRYYTFYINDANGGIVKRNTSYEITMSLNSSRVEFTFEVLPWEDSELSVDGNEITPSQKANSYIVAPGGTIYIPVSQANDWTVGQIPTGMVLKDSLIWTDVRGTTSLLGVAPDAPVSEMLMIGRGSEALLMLKAGSQEGNALVAVVGPDKVIKWSWHIWVTGYNPETSAGHRVYTNPTGTYTFMDRFLGATSVTPGDIGTYGLLYQWGRKDPFRGAASTDRGTTTVKVFYNKGGAVVNEVRTVNNSFTIANSIASPVQMNGVFGEAHWARRSDFSINLWGNGGNKSIYDPCPPGWKVPKQDALSGITAVDFPLVQSDGRTWGHTHKALGFFPLPGRSLGDEFILTNTGQSGFLSISDKALGNAIFFPYVYSESVGPMTYATGEGTEHASSVRCVKE